MWVLIDLGYFSFYRYHATKKWWGFKQEFDQKSPWINESEFRNKLLEKYEEYLDKLIKNNNSFLAMDSMDGKNWRKTLYPEYKSQRPKNEDIYEYLKYISNEFIPYYLDKNPNVIYSRREGTEADDLVANRVFDIQSTNKDEKICIIASDMDYLQLIEKNSNLCICDMNMKILSDKELVGKQYLIKKIIYGDTSDNIKPVFRGRNCSNKKKAFLEKCKDIVNLDDITQEYFENQEDYNTFCINRKLMELTPLS
tara:strand:- start:3546 stop:4304 length:759 start_codon:yes stop_codon:yes gene_type:complete